MANRRVNILTGSKMTLGDEASYAKDSFPSGFLPTMEPPLPWMVVEMMVWYPLPKSKGLICPTKEDATNLTEMLTSNGLVQCVYQTEKERHSFRASTSATSRGL